MKVRSPVRDASCESAPTKSVLQSLQSARGARAFVVVRDRDVSEMLQGQFAQRLATLRSSSRFGLPAQVTAAVSSATVPYRAVSRTPSTVIVALRGVALVVQSALMFHRPLQIPLPESRNVWPAIGMNSQSYLPGFSVNFSTP